MTNEVAKAQSSGVSAALAGLKAGISRTRQALPTSSLEPILKMAKDGSWCYGADNVDIQTKAEDDLDAIFAVNPLAVGSGYVCWTDRPDGVKNELKGEVYASITSEAVDPNKLTQHSDPQSPADPLPWKPAARVMMRCTNGEDEGVQVVYKPSSLGGGNFVDGLLDAISKRMDGGHEDIVPLITLHSDNYMHKSYGKTYTPEFKIVGWMGLEDETAPTSEPEVEEPQPEDTPEPEVEEPAAQTKAEPKSETKTAGRTRRRRRAA